MAAVEAHVEHCVPCAAMLERERQVSEGLRALAAATASAAPSDVLESRLRAAFEAEYPPSSSAWWKAAAAAAALVAATGWWWTSRDTRNVAEPGPALHATGGTPRPSAVVAPPPDSLAPAPTPPVRHERPPRSRPRPEQAETEFVALPAAAGLPEFESGVIVRVELPVAALPAYGLEIVPGRSTAVEADLLIGQDGQARAIRLVSRPAARSGAEQ